jgi:hypothetical protein
MHIEMAEPVPLAKLLASYFIYFHRQELRAISHDNSGAQDNGNLLVSCAAYTEVNE